MNDFTHNPLRADPVFRSSRVIPESASDDTIEQRIARLESIVIEQAATIITNPENLMRAVQGESGTRIVRARA